MVDLIVAADVVLPVTSPPLYAGGVVVADGRVSAVGPLAELRASYPDVPVHEHRGLLSPGLVNAHAHLEYGPSFADLATSGLPFGQWIRTLTGRRRAMTEEQWLDEARGSVRQLLETGTTCVADVVTNGPGIKAAGEAELAGISYVEAVGADRARWPAEQQRVRDVIAAHAGDGRDLGLSPHALYTLGTEVFRDCLAWAAGAGRRVHTHLAESEEEVEFVLAGGGPIGDTWRAGEWDFELLDGGSGTSPTRHLADLGGVRPDVHVAHGVHVDAHDRALLRARSCSVALCTRSNAILQSGQAPVAAYLSEGSPVALGTDSLASSPDLDLLAEGRALRALAESQGWSGAAEQLVRALTVGGAEAMGLADVGRLEPGARADLAVFETTGPDPYEALLSTGRCTATYVLGGRVF